MASFSHLLFFEEGVMKSTLKKKFSGHIDLLLKLFFLFSIYYTTSYFLDVIHVFIVIQDLYSSINTQHASLHYLYRVIFVTPTFLFAPKVIKELLCKRIFSMSWNDADFTLNTLASGWATQLVEWIVINIGEHVHCMFTFRLY